MTSKRLNILITVIACTMGLYHLAFTQYLFTSPKEHQNFHLAFVLLLVFLTTYSKKPKLRPLMLVFILAALAGTAYVAANFAELELRAGFPVTTDIFVSIGLIILCLEACREAYGLTIPIMAIIFVTYLFLGQYVPEPLSHASLNPQTLISWLGVGFNGVYGMSLGVSANYLFLFMVFGGIIRASNVGPLFLEMGKLLSRKLKGGAAQTAVISSALVGTVTGSAVANIPISGSMTIPMMKRVGYKPEVAAAIEASASTGGQIMPPVMGASAFMMAGLTGIPYYKICIAAVIPAILYFTSIGIYVEFTARRTKIPPLVGAVDWGIILRKWPLFIVPFMVLVAFFLQGRTPMYVAFWAVLATIAITYITSVFTKERPSLSEWMRGFSEGVIDGAKLGTSCATLGLIISSVVMTGLGMKLSGIVTDLSQGNLWLAAILTMLVSLVIGCGVPTLPAYVLVAVLIAPALIRMGTSMMAAHLFCIYFAVFSSLTPPVAQGALVAAQIAGAGYIKTAIVSTKFAIIAITIPYVFLYNPAFILQAFNPLLTVTTFVAVLLSLLPLGAVLTGQCITRLNWQEMVLSALTVAILLGSAITKSYIGFGIGVILFTLFSLEQLRRGKAAEPALEATSSEGQ